MTILPNPALQRTSPHWSVERIKKHHNCAHFVLKPTSLHPIPVTARVFSNPWLWTKDSAPSGLNLSRNLPEHSYGKPLKSSSVDWIGRSGVVWRGGPGKTSGLPFWFAHWMSPINSCGPKVMTAPLQARRVHKALCALVVAVEIPTRHSGQRRAAAAERPHTRHARSGDSQIHHPICLGIGLAIGERTDAAGWPPPLRPRVILYRFHRQFVLSFSRPDKKSCRTTPSRPTRLRAQGFRTQGASTWRSY